MEIPVVGKVKRPLPWIIGLIVVSTLGLGAFTVFAINNSFRAREDIDDLTITATQEALVARIQASGTVTPVLSVNISPKNAGRIQQLLVEQGQRVKQGQPLAVMENAEIRMQGAQAEANIREAIAAFEEAQVKINGEIAQAEQRFNQAQAQLAAAQQTIPAQVNQAAAQVQAAQTRLGLAERRVERNRTLEDEGAISRDSFDEVKVEYVNAQVALAEAQQRLQEVRQISSGNLEGHPEFQRLIAAAREAEFALKQRQASASRELNRLKAAVESAQANLERIKVLFQDTRIVAPFDGIITQRYANVGAFVTPTTSASSTASATSTSILAIAQGLEVIAKVPEVDVSQLQEGQPVQVMADAYPDLTFRGQVRQVAPEAIIEQNVTSFEVKIALAPEAQETLKSGMNVDVTFIGQRLNTTVVVPTVAIVTEDGEQGVLIVGEDNKPEFRPVTIGLTLGDQTQVLEGLEPGERLFIDLPDDSPFEE
ncbi:MAG: efflux RND transporter periplasmic adaptor subunit [Jaaginema sp. PMC 1079.18]|nr:efflux RND transporter periplasmic adaptor subunit [Jaaginema sp. PMC 1080.18]MEC4851332.1 efflux RND transporter periplasmic adaptor subunit [Jaaginema sp. PMC 1079.18]MEC4865855.1 efflux RND transporter periplasmic adaptor subunit [Jaaginema sp. PMC 1078.18]